MPTACTPLPTKSVQRIKKLADQGLSKTAIAKVTGHSINSVDKYLAVTDIRRNDIATFKDHLSQLLHESLLSGMLLQANVLTSLHGEDLSSLSIAERKNLLSTLGTTTGILYDKIRLQDGKSTVNSSHRIQLESVHSTLYVDEKPEKVVPSVPTTKGQTCGIMGQQGVEGTQPIDSIEITEDEV